MHKSNWTIKSVLFDLDGTLADTLQDMCDSLNRVLEKREYKKVDCKSLKKYISQRSNWYYRVCICSKWQIN